MYHSTLLSILRQSVIYPSQSDLRGMGGGFPAQRHASIRIGSRCLQSEKFSCGFADFSTMTKSILAVLPVDTLLDILHLLIVPQVARLLCISKIFHALALRALFVHFTSSRMPRWMFSVDVCQLICHE